MMCLPPCFSHVKATRGATDLLSITPYVDLGHSVAHSDEPLENVLKISARERRRLSVGHTCYRSNSTIQFEGICF